LAPVLLIVDDEPPVQELLADTFAAAGYAVATAGNGREAIEMLEREAFRPDGLVTDLRLGHGPDGWSVARRARELQPDLPVIYITGARGDEMRPPNAPAGVMLLKPFSREQVLMVTAALLC
jgi:CheY-like chemotaxis protein